MLDGFFLYCVLIYIVYVLLSSNCKSINSSSREEHRCVGECNIVCVACSCKRYPCDVFPWRHRSREEDGDVNHSFISWRWGIIVRGFYRCDVWMSRFRIVDEHKTERLCTLKWFFTIYGERVVCYRITDVCRGRWGIVSSATNICS